MRIQRPEVIPDGLYSQTQAAKLLEVDRHTVRRYELDGLITFNIRKAGSQKVTTGEEILKCWGSIYNFK